MGRRGHIVLKYRRDECMQRNQTRETLGNVEKILSIKRNRKKVNGSTGIGKGGQKRLKIEEKKLKMQEACEKGR